MFKSYTLFAALSFVFLVAWLIALFQNTNEEYFLFYLFSFAAFNTSIFMVYFIWEKHFYPLNKKIGLLHFILTLIGSLACKILFQCLWIVEDLNGSKADSIGFANGPILGQITGPFIIIISMIVFIYKLIYAKSAKQK